MPLLKFKLFSIKTLQLHYLKRNVSLKKNTCLKNTKWSDKRCANDQKRKKVLIKVPT